MKVITLYELLGLIKDDKAPKKINEIINGIKYGYKFNEKTQWYETLDDTSNMNIFAKDRLNHKVEIIEEEKDIEEIKITKDDNCKRFIEYDDKTGHHKYTIRLVDEYFSNKINELVRVTKQLKKEINMIKKEGK